MSAPEPVDAAQAVRDAMTAARNPTQAQRMAALLRQRKNEGMVRREPANRAEKRHVARQQAAAKHKKAKGTR